MKSHLEEKIYGRPVRYEPIAVESVTKSADILFYRPDPFCFPAVLRNMSAEDVLLQNAAIEQAVGIPDALVESHLEAAFAHAGNLVCP